MPKKLRILLALLLLALPGVWWGLSTPSEAPAASGPVHASARPGSSPASPVPHASGTPKAEEPAAGEPPSEEDLDAELLEDELAGPGPCIELQVTARGAPVPNARVGAVHLESEGIYLELSPLSVGPEGRRQAWCKSGEYRLVNGSGAPALQWVSVDAGTPGEQQLFPTPDGRFELIALEPGPHRLALGRSQHFLVELHEGEALDVGTVIVGSGPR